MSKSNQVLRVGFALFSALTSFLFVYYAVSVIHGSEASQWLRTFAYVAGGYGLMNIYLLSWAWRSQAGWTVMANMAIGVFVVEQGGRIHVFENQDDVASATLFLDISAEVDFNGERGLLGLAFVLGVNWFAVKVLCQQSDDRRQK